MAHRDSQNPRGTRNKPASLADLGPFAALRQKATRLDALDRALRQTLPLALREQVRFADVRYGRLVFTVSTPAWASRLRTMQAQLVATARSLGVEADTIKLKVAPVPLPPPEPPAPKPLSPEAAGHLQAAARAAGDPEMRALFERLAALAGHG